MANNISKKLEESWKKLPNAINGNGQNFIFLLKTLLGDLKDDLDDKFEEISKISNSVTDAPEEMDEQLQNCKIQEVRVGTNISFVLTWDYSNVKNYDSAEIYIKETKGNIANHKNWDEVEVSRTIRTTKTDTVTVDGINAGYIYQITFQAKNTFGSVSRKSGCPVLQYEVSAINNSPDPPLEFNVYFNKSGVLWTWKQPANLDSSYSELRTNTDVGNKVGLLEVTQDTKSTVLPPTREGTAYLYNKGYGSKYSTPITRAWSKPVPEAPQVLTVNTEFQGLLISYSPIPEDCIGICISINGEKHFTSDDSFHYYCVMGNFTVKAAYYDCFGEGVWTNEQTANVVTEVDPDWLKAESISLDKVDKAIQKAVKDAQDSVEGISSAKSSISDLEKNLSNTKSDLIDVSNNLVTKSTELSNEITGVKTNLSGLTSIVNNNSGNITELQQRADTIETTVANNNKNLSSRISQNAGSISSVVANLNSTDITNSPYKTITTLKQTTDSISSTVSANKESADTAISQVSQKADGIKATIESNLNSTDTSTNAYKSIVQLQANINGVSSIVAKNKTEQGKINNSYLSQINQNEEGITSVTARVDTAEENITQIKQTESSIQTTVADNKKAQDTKNESFASQITQNANSITSVVTDLSNTNKDLASTKEKVDSNYTAILQNQNDIALRVKTGELIQQINLSKEGVAINGSKVHITGETVFDNGVIVSSYLGDKQIVGTKIADGAITTGKLSANSVTAGKLASNSVTTDKIAAGAIKSDKLDTGAVTADKIKAGAITADKLTSGAVTADKLAANTINLSGALKVVGGNVTLDENGLSVSQNNGTCTKFNKSGMIFVDSKGNSFSGIGRFCTGTADDGQMVRFDNPWDIIPVVFTFPVSLQTSITGYTNANLYQYIRAEDVSASGFRVACRTILKSGSNGYQLVNSLINPGQFDIPKGGITKTVTWSTNIPNTASVFYIDGSLVAHGYHEKPRSLQISGAGSQTIDGKAYEVWGDLEILSDNKSIFKQSNYSYYSYESGGSYSATSLPTGLSVAGKSNIKFVATLRYIYYRVDYGSNRKHVSHSPSGDTAIASYSGLKINSYRFNTTSDQVICRGTAGFIAVDPNTVPYSVS